MAPPPALRAAIDAEPTLPGRGHSWLCTWLPTPGGSGYSCCVASLPRVGGHQQHSTLAGTVPGGITKARQAVPHTPWGHIPMACAGQAPLVVVQRGDLGIVVVLRGVKTEAQRRDLAHLKSLVNE